MQEFVWEIKRTLRQLGIWALLLVSSASLVGYAWLVPSLLFGVMAGMLYFLQLCYRLHKSADLPVGKAVTYMRIGCLLRLGFIVLVLLLAMYLPNINFWAVVAGLFSLQMIIIMNAIVKVLKKEKRTKKGCKKE